MKKLLVLVTLVLAVTAVIPVIPAEAADSYRVKSGDTLWGISQKTGVSVEMIIELNNITDPGTIYIGQNLVLSASTGNQSGGQTGNNGGNQTSYRYYTVKSGDMLYKIAQRAQTTVEQLIVLNNIQPPYYLYIGQTLRVPVPAETNTGGNTGGAGQPGGNYLSYTVKPGDILWNIAQRYHTTVAKLVKLNNVKSAYDLYPGRKLLIPVTVRPGNNTGNNGNSGNSGNNNRSGNSYVPYYFYKIKAGDKVWTIADNFGIRVSTLLRYNNIADTNEIQVGEVLVIPLNQSDKLSYLKNASRKLNNYYRVRPNETLADIAQYFMVPEEGLRAINNLTASEGVYTGEKLLMPVSPALFKKHKLYNVQSGGEYIFNIAYNNGISINSLLKANYLRNKNLRFKQGTKIIIPLDQDSQATWIDYENGEPVNSWF